MKVISHRENIFRASKGRVSPLQVNPLLNEIARTTTSYLAPRRVTFLSPREVISLRPEIDAISQCAEKSALVRT